MVENGIGIIERGDTYLLDLKFREDNAAVNPDSVLYEVTFPCDDGSANGSCSTTATTGRWDGAYSTDSAATYGEYRVKITAVYETNTYVFETFFYILPWNISQHVRSVSGIKQSNDIDDKDIAIICWNAYLEAKEHVFKRVINEPLKVDAYHCINGTNTEFFSRRDNIVTDHIVCDENIIDGTYVDGNGDKQQLTTSVDTAITGELTISDKEGNALEPNDCCCPTINYRIKSHAFSEQLFKKAVVYLASHEIILRFNELDKATLADLNSNKPIILANPDRMYNKYKKTISTIKKLKVGGV